MRYKSPSRAKIDDEDFPVRICVRVPDLGFGPDLNRMTRWLDANAGPGQWAWHGGGLGGDRSGIYLRRPEVAVDFLAAFPQLELADNTGRRPPPGPPLAPH